MVKTRGNNPRSKKAARRAKRRTAARASVNANESRKNLLKKVTGDRWKRRAARIRAIRAMVRKLEKPLDKISKADFKKAGLGHVLSYWYNGSIKDALNDAGIRR